MKKSLNLFSIFILSSLFLISCSKELDSAEVKNESVTDNGISSDTFINDDSGAINVESSRPSNPEIDVFLADYYSIDYEYGRSELAVDDNGEYEVTEVIVSDNNTSFIGYIVTDANTGEFLQFVNQDRDNAKMQVYDFTCGNRGKTIDYDENLFNTDLITELQNRTNNSGRKFWGNECGPGPTTGSITCCYYVLFVQVSCVTFDFTTPCYGFIE